MHLKPVRLKLVQRIWCDRRTVLNSGHYRRSARHSPCVRSVLTPGENGVAYHFERRREIESSILSGDMQKPPGEGSFPPLFMKDWG